jgi:hypothetical protein
MTGRPPNWDRYLDPFAPSAVPDMMRFGYLRPFEAFLREVRPESLSLSREGELPGDLQQVSRQSQSICWEFRHSVDAVQLLHVDKTQVPGGKETAKFPTDSQLRVEHRRASVG